MSDSASTSTVCTLFEGHYHFGFGALANSLSAAGFKGKLFAGYRGSPPAWWSGRSTNRADGTSVMFCGDIEMVLVPVDTPRHLTNYKPEFMLEVWTRFVPESSRLFYFDADIVVLGRWTYFETWSDAGVALVMDGNTPVPLNHPLRVAWRHYFAPYGFQFAGQHDYYFNGGFIGVNRAHREALVAWKDIQSAMEVAVPLNLPVGLKGAPDHMRDRLFPFFLTDQDALNVMSELEGVTVAPMGPEGMGWKIPRIFMMHALGTPKPWQGRYLRQARRGLAPTAVDDVFWSYVSHPLQLFAPKHVRRMKQHMSWAHLLAPLGALTQRLRAIFGRGIRDQTPRAVQSPSPALKPQSIVNGRHVNGATVSTHREIQ